MQKNIQILIGLLILTALYLPKENIIDRVASQWLFLSVINLGALSYNLFLTFKGSLKTFKTPASLKTILILFIWALGSILYTSSFQITVIDVSRFFIYLVTFYNLLIIFNEVEISFKQISYLFTILFIYEAFFPFKTFYIIIAEGMFENLSNIPFYLQGKASNINITSFSIALKTPFLIYLYYKEKSNFLRVIFIILIIFSYVLLNLTDTRSITLVNFFILFLILGFSLINFNKKLFLKSTILILTIILSFNLPSLLDDNRVDKSQEIISLTTNNDDSSNQRIRYYKAGIQQIINNPVLGVGFGSWKIESVQNDKNSGIEYIVPYHMHNDFLQFGAELGLVGIILYIIFFFSVFFRYIIDVKNLKVRYDLNALVSLLFFTYIFFDSSLNFPYQRPMVYLQFLIFIAFLEKQQNKYSL